MKYFVFLPALFIVPFLLTACGPPTVFGIPQDQWMGTAKPATTKPGD